MQAPKFPRIADRPERPHEEPDDPGHRVNTDSFVIANPGEDSDGSIDNASAGQDSAVACNLVRTASCGGQKRVP